LVPRGRSKRAYTAARKRALVKSRLWPGTRQWCSPIRSIVDALAPDKTGTARGAGGSAMRLSAKALTDFCRASNSA